MIMRNRIYLTLILSLFLCPTPGWTNTTAPAQSGHSYTLSITPDKDYCYAGDPISFNLQLTDGRKPLALDSVDIEATMLPEGQALSLNRDNNSVNFLCVESSQNSPAVEIAVYQANRAGKINSLEQRQKKIQEDIARLRQKKKSAG